MFLHTEYITEHMQKYVAPVDEGNNPFFRLFGVDQSCFKMYFRVSESAVLKIGFTFQFSFFLSNCSADAVVF